MIIVAAPGRRSFGVLKVLDSWIKHGIADPSVR
jgi:hypothetical protein